MEDLFAPRIELLKVKDRETGEMIVIKANRYNSSLHELLEDEKIYKLTAEEILKKDKLTNDAPAPEVKERYKVPEPIMVGIEPEKKEEPKEEIQQAWVCDDCGKACKSRLGLVSHSRKHK